MAINTLVDLINLPPSLPPSLSPSLLNLSISLPLSLSLSLSSNFTGRSKLPPPPPLSQSLLGVNNRRVHAAPRQPALFPAAMAPRPMQEARAPSGADAVMRRDRGPPPRQAVDVVQVEQAVVEELRGDGRRGDGVRRTAGMPERPSVAEGSAHAAAAPGRCGARGVDSTTAASRITLSGRHGYPPDRVDPTARTPSCKFNTTLNLPSTHWHILTAHRPASRPALRAGCVDSHTGRTGRAAGRRPRKEARAPSGGAGAVMPRDRGPPPPPSCRSRAGRAGCRRRAAERWAARRRRTARRPAVEGPACGPARPADKRRTRFETNCR